MRNTTIYELPYRGDVWRLEVATHQGRTFCNLRRWFDVKGEMRPTKDGLIFPLEELGGLHEAIGEYLKDAGGGLG
jgi:hypothetical protein